VPEASGAVLRHVVRPDFLAEAEEAGGLTPDIARRTAEALGELAQGTDAVLLTCSTLGPAAEAVPGPVPVLRVDAALASQAVATGGRVIVLYAVETTREPTRLLFEAAARGTGAAIEMRLVPGGWDAFRAGDTASYLALVAEAARKAGREGATRVVLAQASMAGAVRLVPGRPPLTSPAAGLQAALAAIRRRT
jgi:hypothetical protein